MTTKTYTGYLIVDYRDDDLRFRKTKPSKSDRTPSEYPVKVEVTAEVPDYDIPTLAADLNVPEAQVRAAAADDLLAEGEVPEWHETVEQGFEHFPDRLNDAAGDPNGLAFDDAVSTVVGYVMRHAEGYPDPAEVESHVEDRLAEVVA